MPRFRYRTYGLNVESEIACPDLIPTDGEPDVRVRYGPVPCQLAGPHRDFGSYQTSSTDFLLNLPDVGHFWVSNGEEVVIEAAEGAESEASLQAHTFGSIFGVVLHQRRTLPLHASAIETKRGAVLFTGPSGHGKSTLAGEFSRRGYRTIADDICAITIDEGIPRLHPARPTILLRSDSLQRLDMRSQELRPAPHNPDKCVVSVADKPNPEPTPVRAIFALNPSDSPAIRCTHLSGFEKVVTLAANVFRVYLLSGTDALSTYFDELATLAARANVVKVERPAEPFLLKELADQIEENL